MINEEFKHDVDKGLSASPKYLDSKYFYDARGDELFVKIMHMPEYYLTDAEMEVFKTRANDIVHSFGINGRKLELIELGAGDGSKTVELLKKMQGSYQFTYIPIDISEHVLRVLCNRLADEVPGMKAKPMHGDYFEILELIKDTQVHKIILFLGSTIGNLPEPELFVTRLAERMHAGDKLLLGVDLKKDPDIILKAYNDAQGITREFNLNLLRRINRELGGNFDVSKFRHTPLYNEQVGQAESYIESTEEQFVTIAATGKTYHFNKGERIHTEISRKFDDKAIEQLITDTGLYVKKKCTDSKNYYADYLLEMK
ncbi:MAG: L-histidine N(alpha)-methyltransferase [Taibaiella sp.]|nr:L-histidine N(alpha)-methyltransferase [Taibaiella sp.]